MFPLLTVSSQQARDILASRAEQLLGGGVDTAPHPGRDLEGEGEEIPCTPAFGSSSLAGQLRQGVRGGGEGQTSSLVGQSGPTVESTAGVGGGGERQTSCESDEHLFLVSSEEEIEADECPPNLHKDRNEKGEDRSESAKCHPGLHEAVRNGGRDGTEESGGDFGGDGVEEMDCQPSSSPRPVSATQVMDPVKTSFAKELKGVAYPTLWELGSGEMSADVLGDFYVSALSSLVSPTKVHTVIPQV